MGCGIVCFYRIMFINYHSQVEQLFVGMMKDGSGNPGILARDNSAQVLVIYSQQTWALTYKCIAPMLRSQLGAFIS
jgi:hypothetical protein